MRNTRYWITTFLLLLVQAMVCTFVYLSPYVILNILPVVVMCLPLKHSGVFALPFAFAAGFFLDFVSGGVLGMTSASILVVALLRVPIFKILCDEELFSHIEGTPTSHIPPVHSFFALFFACLLFFATYSWIDGAGTRPFWFNFSRTLISAVVNTLLGLVLARFIYSESAPRWK